MKNLNNIKQNTFSEYLNVVFPAPAPSPAAPTHHAGRYQWGPKVSIVKTPPAISKELVSLQTQWYVVNWVMIFHLFYETPK